MRANVVLQWKDDKNMSHGMFLDNIYGVDYNQIARRGVNESRNHLVEKEQNWNGVDPIIKFITITSHGVE